MKIKLQRKKPGFTMIEILVTATIIAVLTAIGLVSFQRANMKARNGKRLADMQQVRAALEIYRSDNPQYPITVNWASMTVDLSDYFASSDINDPKNVDPHVYTYDSADGSTYEICAMMEPNPPTTEECFLNP